MNSTKKAVLYGVLIWALVFAFSFLIFPLRVNNRAVFESLMPLAIAFCTVFFSTFYFKNIKNDFLKEGIYLGLLWFVINIIIDIPLFSGGPMAVRFIEYLGDIGLTYLIIPIVTIGFGIILKKNIEGNK